jgi:predicted Ser/Thr protein kinase
VAVTDQTNQWGRRLEELYEACMDCPAAERDAFIANAAGGDAELARQLRMLVRLEDPVAANPLSTHAPGGDADGFEFASNTEFGKFRIVTGHGAGAMGAVYLALDLENHNRRVALKVMKPTLLRDDDRRRFSDETSALSRLVHPNIAQLYFWGIQPWQGADRPFLVMEHVDGQTLDSYLAERHHGTREVLELLRKIALAVHHGHLKGVFHRDLKPSNILVTRDGEPKIIDFGVSFMVSTGTAPGVQTQLDENVGTPQYMAPEVAAARPYSPDPRTDVYSLGVIAFEAFARRRPGVVLPAGGVQQLDHPLDTFEIRRRIADCERERLRSAGRGFGRDLDCVIAMALRLRMEDRYTDAGELAADFCRLLDLEPVRARPASRVYGTAMFVRRNRLAVAAAAVVLLAIVGAAIGFGIGDVRAKAALKDRTAALVEKTGALGREQAALDVAHRERAVIDQQVAAAHFRTAVLADQRGDWSLAVDEYKAADAGGYAQDPARQLAVSVGELRALDRSGRKTEAAALIARIDRELPGIAASPGFQVVEGFTYWTTKPNESLAAVRRALSHGEQLPPGDRAFAEALTTDDIRVVEPRLRETVKYDPFNRDAWALLALCDLVLGEAQKCEQDAGVLQRLYPEDQVGTVLAAFGAAFEGRHPAAAAYLDGGTKLPAGLKATLNHTLDFIGQFKSVEDVIRPAESVRTNMFDLVMSAVSNTGPQGLPTPVTFRRLIDSASPWKLLTAKWKPDVMWEVISGWPNGDGELALGWLALEHNDYPSAILHLNVALKAPALVDCRRFATIALMYAHMHDRLARDLPFDKAGAALIRADAEQLIACGGVRPDKLDEESNAFSVLAAYGLWPQVRTMALLWLSHSPDDPRAIYYLGVAQFNLDDRVTAAALLKRAVAAGLAGDLKQDAEAKLRELARGPESRPVAAAR